MDTPTAISPGMGGSTMGANTGLERQTLVLNFRSVDTHSRYVAAWEAIKKWSAGYWIEHLNYYPNRIPQRTTPKIIRAKVWFRSYSFEIYKTHGTLMVRFLDERSN